MFWRFGALTLAAASALNVFALVDPAAAGGNPRHAALILDANSGAVLHNENGDALRHPASLTKMMTLYLTFEALQSGRLSLNSRVPISAAAAGVAPSKLGIDVGDDISVSDAIRALITKSANDVAVALAEKVGGSEPAFVRLMNARAREIGMSKTRFENASGLPDPDQVTTARDMITLGLHLQDDYPAYYPLFSLRAFSYGSKSYRNHNTMLNSFAGIDGIKTGYTRMSGFNLVSSVRRGGKHIVGAVFGGASAATRNGEMRILLTKSLTLASSIKTRKPMLIARLKADPKPALRPGPKLALAAVSAPLQAKAVVAAKPASAPRPALRPALPPDGIAAAAVAAEPAAAPAPVEIFKVRRVVVANRAPPASAPAEPSTDVADAGSIEAVLRASERAGALEERSADTAPRLALAEVAPAPLFENRMSAGLGALAARATGAETVVPKRAAARAPSTLGSQLAELVASPAEAAPSVQPASRQPGWVDGAVTETAALPPRSTDTIVPPSARTRSSSPQDYDIQIGAYPSDGEARRVLQSAQTSSGAALAGTSLITQRIDVNGRPLYRARFRGLNSRSAQTACSELRRQQYACMVVSAN